MTPFPLRPRSSPIFSAPACYAPHLLSPTASRSAARPSPFAKGTS